MRDNRPLGSPKVEPGLQTYDAVLDPIASLRTRSTCGGKSRAWIKRLGISAVINETCYELMVAELIEERDSPSASSRAAFLANF